MKKPSWDGLGQTTLRPPAHERGQMSHNQTPPAGFRSFTNGQLYTNSALDFALNVMDMTERSPGDQEDSS